VWRPNVSLRSELSQKGRASFWISIGTRYCSEPRSRELTPHRVSSSAQNSRIRPPPTVTRVPPSQNRPHCPRKSTRCLNHLLETQAFANSRLSRPTGPKPSAPFSEHRAHEYAGLGGCNREVKTKRAAARCSDRNAALTSWALAQSCRTRFAAACTM
jgi:hypothetical protein